MVGLLIRHGHSEAAGRWLAGRREGVNLTSHGREAAETLSMALRWLPLTAIYSSPLARAQQTADPLARDHGLIVHTRPALTDIDFGEWTGESLDDLARLPEWHTFNRERCRARAPGGESLADVQRRVVEELLCLSRTHAGEMVAIVTHAEPIRCAIAAFENASLDQVQAIEITPAHVSTVGIGPTFRRVLSVNLEPALASA